MVDLFEKNWNLARPVYRAEDIHFDRRFADIIGRLDDGRWTIGYERFHELAE